MAGAAARLLDWEAAKRIGGRLSGPTPGMRRADRARLAEELDDAVAHADSLVTEFTGLRIDAPASRAWVMTRREWLAQNLRGFEQILEPVASRLVGRRPDGALAPVRRSVLAFQVGGILGYLSRRVLGQYDLFLPPDDRDLIYFVGPNVVELERKHRFDGREFRLWLALHEVTHRVQFEGVPWLRGYLGELIETYLQSLNLDARELIERLRRAREEIRRNGEWKEMGVLSVLMTPEQRDTFRKMQALMSLLEGHGNYVMDRLSDGRIGGAPRMRRTLRERRRKQGLGKVVQRAVGLDVKGRQYDTGERFVSEVVRRGGAEGFARVWEAPEHLPTLAEIARPRAWVERVAAAN
ncbi:MAG TPA: zinc-dependent metalloprotease [Actinomycetota bacterium]|nr:zinc-dependent metalloprotease [Actinomycetota bacterium]